MWFLLILLVLAVYLLSQNKELFSTSPGTLVQLASSSTTNPYYGRGYWNPAFYGYGGYNYGYNYGYGNGYNPLNYRLGPISYPYNYVNYTYPRDYMRYGPGYSRFPGYW